MLSVKLLHSNYYALTAGPQLLFVVACRQNRFMASWPQKSPKFTKRGNRFDEPRMDANAREGDRVPTFTPKLRRGKSDHAELR